MVTILAVVEWVKQCPTSAVSSKTYVQVSACQDSLIFPDGEEVLWNGNHITEERYTAKHSRTWSKVERTKPTLLPKLHPDPNLCCSAKQEARCGQWTTALLAVKMWAMDHSGQWITVKPVVKMWAMDHSGQWITVMPVVKIWTMDHSDACGQGVDSGPHSAACSQDVDNGSQ